MGQAWKSNSSPNSNFFRDLKVKSTLKLLRPTLLCVATEPCSYTGDQIAGDPITRLVWYSNGKSVYSKGIAVFQMAVEYGTGIKTFSEVLCPVFG